MGTYDSHMTAPMTHLVAARVRDEMASRGVSVKELADATGLARMTLTRRLTGHSPFTIAELDTLSAHFGTTADRLMADARKAGAA